MDEFRVSFIEKDGKVSIKIIDLLTKTETELIEDECKNDGFNMFSIGKFVLEAIKPKYRDIVKAPEKVA